MTAGRAVRLLLLLVAVALAVLALGAPRFTWANDGVRVDHPWSQGACGLAAGAAIVASAWGARPRARLPVAGVGALACAALAAQRLVWRIDAVAPGLHARSLAGRVELAWRDVAAVEPRDGSLTLRGADGRTVVIGTRGFAPDERIRLERTIARRVLEASK